MKENGALDFEKAMSSEEKIMLEDVKEIIRKQLILMKLKIATDVSIENLIKLYLENRKKYFLINRKFKVVCSECFIKKTIMLTKKQKNAILDIKQKIEDNISIRAYFSNNLYLTKMSKEDVLLNKYGIYHVHLGQIGPKNRFVERTSKLLFFTYNKENVYFLDLKKHPLGNEWYDSELIELANMFVGDRVELLPKCEEIIHEIDNYVDLKKHDNRKIEICDVLDIINLKNIE